MITEIWKQIKQKKIAPIYLLYGTESFLINETKQLLLNEILADDEKDFNFSTFDLTETPIEVALEDAETFPFMGEKKVLFLHNPAFLTSEKTKEKFEHNLTKLEAYMKEPAPYSVVIFTAPYEKLDERKKITKELKRSAVTFEAKKLNEHELKGWVKERAKMNGITMEADAIDRMLVLAGTNMFLLTSELDKLSLFAYDDKMITVELVENLVSKSLEQNIFTLIEKVVQRKLDEALRIYYDLLKQNEEPIKILALLTSQFRLIYQVKELTRKGYGQQQIASHLKIHPFRVKLAAGQMGKFTEQELVSLINGLAEADYQMKTGGMNKSLLVEMLLFRIKQ